jgi:hypothetical protein
MRRHEGDSMRGQAAACACSCERVVERGIMYVVGSEEGGILVWMTKDTASHTIIAICVK